MYWCLRRLATTLYCGIKAVASFLILLRAAKAGGRRFSLARVVGRILKDGARTSLVVAKTRKVVRLLGGQTVGEIYGEISVAGQTVGLRRNSGWRTDGRISEKLGRISEKFRWKDRLSENFGET